MPDVAPVTSTAKPVRPVRAALGTLLDLRNLSGGLGTVLAQNGDGSVVVSRVYGNQSTDKPVEMTITADQFKNAEKIRTRTPKPKFNWREPVRRPGAPFQFEVLGQDAKGGRTFVNFKTDDGKISEAWVDTYLLNQLSQYTGIFPDEYLDKLAKQASPRDPSGFATSLGSKSAEKKLAEEKKKKAEEEKEEPKKEEEKPPEEKNEEEKNEVPKPEAPLPPFVAATPSTVSDQAARYEKPKEVETETETTAEAKVEEKKEAPKTIGAYRGLRADPNFDNQLQKTSWQILATSGAAVSKAYSGINEGGQLIKVDGTVSSQKAFDLIPKSFKLPVVSQAMVQFAGQPQAAKYNLVTTQIAQPPIDMPALATQVTTTITTSLALAAPSAGADIGAVLTGFQSQIAQRIAVLDQNLGILNARLGQQQARSKQITDQLKLMGARLNQQVGSKDDTGQVQTRQTMVLLQQEQTRLAANNQNTRTMIGQEQRKKVALESIRGGSDQPTAEEQTVFDSTTPISMAEARPTPPPVPEAARAASYARKEMGVPPPLPAGPSVTVQRTRIKKQVGAPLQSRGYESSAETAGVKRTSDLMSDTGLSDSFEQGLSGAAGEQPGWSSAAARETMEEEEEGVPGGGYVRPLGDEKRRAAKEQERQLKTQRGLLAPEEQATEEEGGLRERSDQEFNPELEQGMEPEEMAPEQDTDESPEQLAEREGAGPDAASAIMSDQDRARKNQASQIQNAQSKIGQAQAAVEKTKEFWRMAGWFDKAFDTVGGFEDGVQFVKLVIGYDIALVRSYIFKDKSVNPYAPQPILPEKYALHECCLAFIFHMLMGLSACMVFVIGFVVIFGPAIIFSGVLANTFAAIRRILGR